MPTTARTKPRPSANKLQIVKLDEISEHIKLFVYGPPKVGKTVLAASASTCDEGAPVLFCDVEAGRLSLMNAPDGLIDKDRLVVVPISRFELLNQVYEKVYANPGRFGTVVIDSISELHTLAMDDVMRETVAKDPTREMYVPSRREWGIVRAQIRMLVREFRDLPVNLILTAMIREDEDETSGAIIRSPQLPGQLRTEIPGYCDIVALMEMSTRKRRDGRTQVKEVVRTLHLSNVARATVGTRGWGYPETIEDPTFESIRAAILTNGG